MKAPADAEQTSARTWLGTRAVAAQCLSKIWAKPDSAWPGQKLLREHPVNVETVWPSALGYNCFEILAWFEVSTAVTNPDSVLVRQAWHLNHVNVRVLMQREPIVLFTLVATCEKAVLFVY